MGNEPRPGIVLSPHVMSPDAGSRHTDAQEASSARAAHSGQQEADRAPSVARLFLDRVAATPRGEAFRFPGDGSWTSVTWQWVGDRVQRFAAGLIALGVAPEERVALASSTRLEWVLVDFAVLCAGSATTTLYPTTNARDVAFIVANSGSRVVVAEDQTQVDKLLWHRAELPDMEKVVIIDGEGDGDLVITLDELEALGERLLAQSPNVVERRVDDICPEHLASIIYTSGTTGRPKGVRLPHRAWVYTAAAIDELGILHADDLNYLWLPLAHAFGKVMLALPLIVGFPTAIDGRVDKIVDNLAVVQPTFMAAAPRIFEKAYARVQATIAEEGGLKKTHLRLGDWSGNQGFSGESSRREAAARALAPARDRRRAGVLDHSETLRGPAAILRFGGCAAEP